MARVVHDIDAVFHDPAAALVVDGVTVAAERFDRRKHGHDDVPFAAWEVPAQAVRWCLEQAGVRPEDLDAVACSYDPSLCEPVDLLALGPFAVRRPTLTR